METEKRIYISADYDPVNGDRDVVDVLNQWSIDKLRNLHFVDMAAVKSGTVAGKPDCRICELKGEFNRQINASSAVIIVVGSRTESRRAGNSCERMEWPQDMCFCTPYKQNAGGMKPCKVYWTRTGGPGEDLGPINSYSYLEHEFWQARRKGKRIVVVYNSMRKEAGWLPDYLKDYESEAIPFWTTGRFGTKVGNYIPIKEALGYV